MIISTQLSGVAAEATRNMDQNLAIECIEVVENLSQREKNKILNVLKRDDKLRIGQEHKIRYY